MFQDTYHVPKKTGTYSDVLVAYGLAALLDQILGESLPGKRRVLIEDNGSEYVLKLSTPIREEWIDAISYFRPPAYYLTRRQEQAPDGLNFRNVDEMWNQVRSYWEQWRALRQDTEMKGSDIEQQLEDMEPPPEWSVVAFVGDGRMQAIGIYDRVVGQWPGTREFFRDTIRTILALYSGDDALGEEWLARWAKAAKKHGLKAGDTASQLLNPHQGKGQNELKANALRMDNIKNQPWIEEFLKTAGLWYTMAPRQIEGGKDWKVYVMAPLHLSLGDSKRAFDDFRQAIWRERQTTNLKADITSLLLFVRTWLDYVEAEGMDELAMLIGIQSVEPEKVVAGFHVAQFKKLSQQAYTMINLSFLQIPAWSGDLKDRADVEALKGVIDEHLEVIRGIDEDRSDGFDLLRRYRDFVAGSRWEAFFDFMHGYSQEIMRQLDARHWAPMFTTTNLGRLVMASKKDLLPIVQSEGFKNVAYAIRHSTVIPQSRKARGQEFLYEIRYGLGADLKRKATVRDEFIAALMDFAHSYNRENAQILESRSQQMRRDLRTSDIEEIVRLVDEYGSEVVANLLVAYGYAREPREDANSEEE